MKTGFITLLFTLYFCTLLSAQVPDSLKYKSLDPDDFLTLLRFRDSVILVDVRMPFEFRKERIVHAVSIPLSRTGKRQSPEIGSGTVILLYCTTDVRSRWAALRYYDLGFHYIFILRGGIEAWKQKGLEVEGKVVQADKKRTKEGTEDIRPEVSDRSDIHNLKSSVLNLMPLILLLNFNYLSFESESINSTLCSQESSKKLPRL